MGKRKSRTGKAPKALRKTPARAVRAKTPGAAKVRPQMRAQPSARDVTVKPPRGLGLGMKIALLVAALISIVALVWGFVLSSIFENALKEQAMMGGTQTAKALAILGSRILERPEDAQNVFLDGLARITKNRSSDIAAAAILDERGAAIVSMSGFESHAGATKVPSGAEGVRVREGYIGTRRGKILARLFYAEFSASVEGVQKRGEAMVALDWRRVSGKIGGVVRMMAVSGVVFVAIGVVASVMLGRTVTQPIKVLMRDMEIVARRDFDHVTRATSSDEIGQLAVAFNRMTRGLKEAEDRKKDAAELEDQVSAAMEIQANLLPAKIPQIPGFDIYPYWRSAKEVGGDYYDFIPVDKERLALVVADVSGKGIPGSMVMATTRTILHMVVRDNPSAADILMKTNAVVAREIKRGMFVTAMLAILNVRQKELLVCSAGHNPMVVYRDRTRTCELVNPNGIALGFDKGPVFNRTLQEKPVKLYTGDRIVLYTDGVVEAMNPKHEEFGDDQFYRFAQQHARLSSKEFVALLIKALDEHKGVAEQHDDITISTFRVE